MKKYLNINTICVVINGLAAITSLVVGNISAFLGWFSAFIFALDKAFGRDCM